MDIRIATLGDLPALLEIYNWAVVNTTATFDLEEQTYEQRLVWFSKFGETYPLVVAVEAEQVIGYACLSKFRDKPAYARSAELSVYVHPDSHGRGVGKALVADIVRRAKELGFHTVIAGIVMGNDVSVRLHENLGFQFVGCFRAVGYKFNAWQDVSFYQLFCAKDES